MPQPSHKLTSKITKPNQPGAGIIKPITKKSPQKSRWGAWLSSTLVFILLLGSAGLMMTFVWISILFIFNPSQLIWVNKILPQWAQIPLGKYEHPHTLSEIQLSLHQEAQIAGEILSLDDGLQNSFLLPVFQDTTNCQLDCRRLVELRVYQRSPDVELQSKSEKYYFLVSQLSITGLDESFVDAPLTDDISEPESRNDLIPLPLTEVKRFEEQTPSSGVWFYLRGERERGSNHIAYGQVIQYNPQNSSLQPMLSWTSPNGQPPKWQQIHGSDIQELVIDQTIGLKPKLKVYQLNRSFLLEEIALKPPAIENSAYKDALLLARSELWTPALVKLKSFQKQRKDVLPTAAQAQIELIRLHSELTRTQANKHWASPSQQIFVNLIDGRWGKALQILEMAPDNDQEIATLLKVNSASLWSRIAVALRVNPHQPEVQAWSSLILAVFQGQESANSWLLAQPKIPKETVVYTQSLLKKLNGQISKSPSSSIHPSRIVGTAQPIGKINSTQWWLPNPKHQLKLTDQQIWYQVDVSSFHNGQNWLNSPFHSLRLPNVNKIQFLWDTLGLNPDPTIQIIVWLADGEQQIITANIQGVQLQAGVLRLLVSGEKIPPTSMVTPGPRPLALTNASLEWLEPSAITILELNQQNPQIVESILPSVWHSLQKSGHLPGGAVPSFPQMLEQMGNWPVQTVDLTNHNQTDLVLTISEDAIASLQSGKFRKLNHHKTQNLTLIFSDKNQLIYNDLETKPFQRLTAIAKPTNESSLAILVETANGYSLKRWSKKNHRFE